VQLRHLLAASLLLAVSSPALARDGEGIDDTRALLGREDAGDDEGWDIGTFGFIRVSYENVQDDPNTQYVGRNDGFVVQHARVGFEGSNDESGLNWRISLEGASDLRNRLNTPSAEIDVRLRDAFMRWDPVSFIGIQAGQMKAPFSQEELRGTPDLLFSNRAVGVEGVLPGRGQQTPGIEIDRQVGVMISPDDPIEFGNSGFGVAYYLMVANGNGANQTLNDNDSLGFVGRLEFVWDDILLFGGAASYNPRTEGNLPNLYEENDLAIAGDLLFTFKGIELFGQYIQSTTSYPTVSAEDRRQTAWHAQAGYRINAGPISITPGYRYATFDPFANDAEGNPTLENLELQYHTMGLRFFHPNPRLGLSAYANYTITVENETRQLDNNRFEALLQLIF
jgi:hypothetical protein